MKLYNVLGYLGLASLFASIWIPINNFKMFITSVLLLGLASILQEYAIDQANKLDEE